MLETNLYPMLRPEWVLRNERSKIICYLMSTEESRHQVLSPEVGFMASFLNGRETVAQVVDDLCYIWHGSREELHRVLSAAIDMLNAGAEKVALLRTPSAEAPKHNPLDFILSSEQFDPNARLRSPISLFIYFCAWCSTNCRYCYADLENMRKCAHLSAAEWLRIVREARDLGIRIIHFTGGDTLRRKDAIAFLSELVQLGFVFLVSTKCYIREDDARRLVDAGWHVPVNGVHRSLQVSVDSCNSETLRLLMGRDGYLDQATDTIGNLLKAGIQPVVKATLTAYNFRDVRDLVERFALMGVRRFRTALYSHSFYRHDDRLHMSEDMKKETAEWLSAIRSEHPELTIDGDAARFNAADSGTEAVRQRFWNSRTNCSAGRTSLGVAPDGRAVLCEQMPVAPPYFVGDLTKQSILDVWNSPQILDFISPARERFIGTACETCSEFEECIHLKGYCFRDAHFVYGRLHHPPPKCPRAPATTFRFT